MRTPRYGTLIATGLWAIAVCAGMGILANHETQPGDATASPNAWPAMSQIARSPGQPHLIMFVHPHCPCTRASIGELALIMSHCQDRLAAHVLVLKPAEFKEEWTRSDLWTSAASVPGVTVMLDNDGIEARRFAAITSGHVVLYDSDGRLEFSGGITGSRGHSGDNQGRSAVVALVTDGAARSLAPDPPATCSVYGCPMSNNPELKSLGD